MPIHSLGHIVLYVSNLEWSVEFYEKVLGWKRLPGQTGFRAAAFSGGSTHHELLLIEVGPDAEPVQKGVHLGLYHFGLKVGDSDEGLKVALKTLEEAGVPLIGATDHTVTHSLYIEDPDGNEIELYIDVPGVDWREEPELLFARPKRLEL